MMRPYPPTSAIGSLQSEIQSLKNELRRAANDYEVSEIRRRVVALESAVREIRAEIDGIVSRLQELQENQLVKCEEPEDE